MMIRPGLISTSRGGTKLNSADKAASATLSNGDLTLTSGSGTWSSARSVAGKSSGKWYFEATIGGTTGYHAVGVANSSTGLESATLSNAPGADTNAWAVYSQRVAIFPPYYLENWNSYHNGAATNVFAQAANDTIMVAADLTAGKIWFGRNGVWVGDPAAGTGEAFSGLSGTLYAILSGYGGKSITGNFGGSAFLYSVPSGFTVGWTA